jgi:hypothetical protein
MSEPASSEEEFQALRTAAVRGDVNGCSDATQKLLGRLPADRALRLVRGFVARRLPLFERHQPGVRWPREFIESISETGSVEDGRRWPEAEDDFPGPGANSFTTAVEALWKASHLQADERRRSEFLTTAIERAVGAERLESWGSRHPEAWARWYQLASTGSDDMSQYDTLLTIKRDPEVVRVQRAAWLEFAQILEEELNALPPESR